MKNKETIRKWNQYFSQNLKRGHSWLDIRHHLIINQEYKASLIEKLIFNYNKEKARRQKISIGAFAALFLLVLILPFFLQRPTITGMPIGGPGHTYYADAVNGDNSNDGTSADKAFKTLNQLLTVISDGDVGYILDGTYTDSNGFTIEDKVLTSGMLITAYPGAHPVLTSRIPEFDTVPNNKWTNLGGGLWSANYSSALAADYWVAAYTNTNVSLFTHSSLANLNNTANPEGIFFDNPNDKIYLKLNNLSADPSQIALSISNTHILRIDNVVGANLEISNLTLLWGFKGVYVTSSSNIIISHNVMAGGLKTIDIRNSGNITIKHNTVFMIQGANWSWQDDTKGSLMETSALWLNNDLSGLDISNNNIYGHFNGILVFATTAGKFHNIKVHDNYIHNIMDDGLELEDYCNGGEFYNNNISNVFVAISMSPADATENTCLIHNNILIANKSVRWNHAGTYYSGECYKIIDSAGCQNINFTHNTCIGRGVYTTENYYYTQKNNIWKDNIFYSTNSRLLDKAGLSQDGVFYDYNLHYRNDGGAIFRYWNNDDDAMEYTTLAAAKGSANWDGAWDIHSQQTNPLFIDAANGDFRPQSGSPACTMSSTGSYVGALPCEEVAPPPEPVCGDAICNGVENCSTCADDCGECPPEPVCGDAVCNGLENCSSCALDCGACPPEPFCGDDVCNGVENCSTCAIDCGECPPEPFCGDAICNGLENCSSCVDDCDQCPISSCTLSGKAWDEDSSLTNAFNLSACFNDPADQPLAFGVAGNREALVSISSDGMVNLSASANWHGVEHIVFSAAEGGRSAYTNNITLTVNSMPDCGDNTCDSNEKCNTCPLDCGTCPKKSSGGGGGGGSSTPSNNSTSSNSKGNTAGQAAIATNTTQGSNVKVKQESEENASSEPATNEPEQQTPGEIEVSSEPKESPTLFVIALSVIVLAIVAAISLLRRASPRIKKPLPSREKKEPEAEVSLPPQDLKRVDLKNNNVDYLVQLHKYVSEASKSGYDRERVRNELNSVGWEQPIVETVLTMHDSEFLPDKVPEPPLYPTQSEVHTQPEAQDTLNTMQKWMEFENTGFEEKK